MRVLALDDLVDLANHHVLEITVPAQLLVFHRTSQ
jgi:hypothetical protein